MVTGGDRGSGDAAARHFAAKGAKAAALELALDTVNGRILRANRMTEMVLTGRKFCAEKGLNAFLKRPPPTFR